MKGAVDEAVAANTFAKPPSSALAPITDKSEVVAALKGVSLSLLEKVKIGLTV